MKNTVNWRSFFTFFVAPSLFLLAGPASPFVAIILIFIALAGVKICRRTIGTFLLASHLLPEQKNLSQGEKAD